MGIALEHDRHPLPVLVVVFLVSRLNMGVFLRCRLFHRQAFSLF